MGCPGVPSGENWWYQPHQWVAQGFRQANTGGINHIDGLPRGSLRRILAVSTTLMGCPGVPSGESWRWQQRGCGFKVLWPLLLLLFASVGVGFCSNCCRHLSRPLGHGFAVTAAATFHVRWGLGFCATLLPLFCARRLPQACVPACLCKGGRGDGGAQICCT